MKNPQSLDSYDTEDDLRDLLIDPRQREGAFFEFKEHYTGPVKNKLGKHVAAFANWHGGLLAIGVEAKNEVAVNLTGIDTKEGFEDSVSQKLASTINTVPLFRTKLVLLQNGKNVLLIRVEESTFPPHLFEGKLYIRPAAGSEPVHPENTAQIDRLYQKRERIEVRLREVLEQTWLHTHNWPNPCMYLIACPLLIQDDLVPDFDTATMKAFKEVAGLLPGGCGEAMVASNELRCRDPKGFYTSRITRYGLIESIAECAQTEEEVVFSTNLPEYWLHDFLQVVFKFYTQCSYFGHFKLILGVKNVGTKRTTFVLQNGSPGESEPAEANIFTVQRIVSLYGEQNVVDYDSRKSILESISREYLGNFGVRANLIEQLRFLDRLNTQW